MNYTIPFGKLNKKDVLSAGGKGASLGEMTQAGIPVPPGFVVSSQTFDYFIKETDLIQEIESILGNVNHEALHTVEDASSKIQNLILNAEIPEDVRQEIEKSFGVLDAEFVAVRSSATAEDGMEHAWAGQLDSYLNVKKEDLFENVKKCWASLFTPRAIFYRFEKELHTTNISVAVVVQKMVNSEISGIAFSVHPVTEDRNQLIIEAGYGLGEAIVSGQVTPDSYVVEKIPQKIIDINVNKQEKALYRNESGGNIWKSFSEKEGGAQILNESQILKLSETIIRIENHYDHPQDIEWAMENEEFYIVQSRPITTLKEENKEWYSKYTWQSAAQDFNSPLIKNLIFVKALSLYKKELDLPKLLIAIKGEAGSLEAFAHIPSWVEAHNALEERVKKDPSYLERELIDKTNELGEQFNAWSEKEIFKADLSQKSGVELMDLYEAFMEKQARMYAYGITLPTLDFGEFSYVEGNLDRILKEKTSKDLYREYHSVLTSPIHNSFAQEQEYDLLSLMAAHFNKEWKEDVLSGNVNLEEKYPAFWNALKEHTQKHGWVYYVYIGPAFTEKDFLNFISQELRSGEDPKDKLERLQKRHKDTLAKREEVIKELKPDSFEEHILRIAGKMMWAKPRRKDYQSKSYYHLERLQQEIADRISVTLDEVRHTPPEELAEYLEGASFDAEKAHQIKKLHIVLPKEDDTEELLYGDDAKEFLRLVVTEKKEIQKGDLSGNVAYAGHAKGRVKIINTPEDMVKMEDGDILVSVATTPSVVPAMKKAAAIVTEEGGLTCHAAIVSRELEIPCVVGTKIATQALKDGDEVEVDADNGVVRVLKS